MPFKQITVGIADCAVAGDAETTIVTFALGSCIGVSIYDSESRVGGLLHFMLPDSALDSERGRNNPFLYGDTGIAALLDRAYKLGASKKRLRIHMAGGAQVIDDGGVFNIGKKNHLSARKALWKAGLIAHTENVGGNVSRSVRLDLQNGNLTIKEGTSSLLAGVPHYTGATR